MESGPGSAGPLDRGVTAQNRVMDTTHFDLAASARAEMIREGFDPDFPPDAEEEVAALKNRGMPGLDDEARDLRELLWSSIDNDTSRDLDQIEFAEWTENSIRVVIGIADVDFDVPVGSAIDHHASSQATTVYTAARVFPMLPEELSTDMTSLVENADRLAIAIEMVVDQDGCITNSSIYRALVRNKAQLTYEGVGPWLEGSGAKPGKVAMPVELDRQLRLQDEAAQRLREQRRRRGALEFERTEAQTVVRDGRIIGIAARRQNRASNLIEDFMIAANEVMARTLRDRGVSAIRRVVKSPERWPRIVELAARYGADLPEEPDAAALAAFLCEQKRKDEVHYADLSLAVVKLMGPGEYVLFRPGDGDAGHFGLAAHDYTHSTAPNRRFADLVIQRLIKGSLKNEHSAYSDDELGSIARTCTLKEDAARKVERTMGKRAAAAAMQKRVGESFDAIVTGVTPKGVFVRTLNPPVEGRLMRGERGVDVGDRVRVTLQSTDPERGYIDFLR